MKLSDSLYTEAFNQLTARTLELIRQQKELNKKFSDLTHRGQIDYLEFRWEPFDEPEMPAVHARARRAVIGLKGRSEYANRTISHIIFRPYPSKYDGAWRVEMSFADRGPSAGVEFYVDEEELFASWEKSGINPDASGLPRRS